MIGPQLQQMRDALCAAFDLEALVQLVRFELDEKLEDLVDCHSPFPTVVFNLLTELEQRGTTLELIRGMYKARPQHPLVFEFCRQQAPSVLETPPPPGELARSVSTTFTGLIPAMTRRPDDRLGQIVRHFQGDFRTACDTITVLDKYKALHDYLHTIDFQLYGVLFRAARDFRKNPQGQDEVLELHDHTEKLGDITERARGLFDGLPTAQVEEGWVSNLGQAVAALRQALQGDPGEPERRALFLVKGVLARHPSRINGQLADQARRLPLPELMQALREVRDELARPGPAPDRPPPDQFDSGLKGLEQLQARLRELVGEHDFWQRIDNDLRLAADTVAQSLDELLFLWPGIAGAARSLGDLRRDSQWAQDLQAAAHRFDKASAAKNPLGVRLAFDDFQRKARGRFFDVDVELRGLCGNLVIIGKPLETLGEVILHDGN